MNVAGSAIEVRLTNAPARSRFGLVSTSLELEVVKLPKFPNTVHQPVVLASFSVRDEAMNSPNVGTTHAKQMMPRTTRVTQPAFAGLPSRPGPLAFLPVSGVPTVGVVVVVAIRL